MTDGKDAALLILERLAAAADKKENMGGLPDDVTIHAIETSRHWGPARTLEGYLLIETSDGGLMRMNGKQLAALTEIAPEFLKHWRRSSAE